MLKVFRTSPRKKLQKKHDALLTRAFKAQRNGNIRLYSSLTAEAHTVQQHIANLDARPSH